jgi:hypothetical protein
VLNASLVSSTWEDFIGVSQICMSKVNLTINGRNYFLTHRDAELKRELQSLCASKRRYGNFVLYSQKPGFLTREVIKFINGRRGKWKGIKMWSERLENQAQVEELLESIAESVEHLELRSIKVASSMESLSSVQFRKLKVLSLSNISMNDCILKSFNCSNSLESLEIENGAGEALTQFISVHPNLTVFSLIQDKTNADFFLQLASVASLKLKCFKLKARSSFSPDQSGLIHFFKSQSNSLERLIIDANYDKELLQSIFELCNLKSLKLSASSDNEIIGLPINKSIVELVLSFCCKQKFILELVKALPGLEVLSIPSDTSMTEESLRRESKNLKILKLH